jgi:hypothetical protein
MRQTKTLVGKIRKLEKRAGLAIPSQIPQDLKTVFFYNQEEDQAPEEINAKIERQKAELVEKYGRRVLNRLHFIVFEDVSSDRKKPSLTP